MIKRVIKYALPLYALLLLPACSQENEPGAETRPMEFSVSISESPQSRVTDNGMGSSWSTGDRILVQVTQGGVSSSAYCTLNSSGEVTAYSQNLFWNGTSTADVVAWYSNITGSNSTAASTISLADQSGELAYVLRASATANYDTQIPLTFTHQLTKVRVKVTGDGAADVSTVKINNYQTCTISDGYVTAGTSGYITTRENGEYFEANVVPTSDIPDDFISFGDDFIVDFNGVESLESGKVYTITIDTSSGTGSSVETTIGGQPAVLMRGAEGNTPALYIGTCNIGASAPAESGYYFYWGDPDGYKWNGTSFQSPDGQQNDISFGTSGTLSSGEYWTNSKSLTDLFNLGIITEASTDGVLTTSFDAATTSWGNGWRMPTKAELTWLIDTTNTECTFKAANEEYVFTTADGLEQKLIYPVAGLYIKSNQTGGVIFLPAAGSSNGKTLGNEGETLCYWSASPSSSSAYLLNRSKAGSLSIANYRRYSGYSIRPVAEK